MSAPVEKRHRDAAKLVLAGRSLEHEGQRDVTERMVARLIADTEAAEREKSAALRAEFEACVRALRGLRGVVLTNNVYTVASPYAPVRVAVGGVTLGETSDAALGWCDAALSGPLASEVRDA